MTATPTLTPSAGTTRPAGPSLAGLTGIEIRKSLSTRSGRAVAAAAALLAPFAIVVGAVTGDGTLPGATVLGIMGMLTALVLLALGVLSTAGEWTHRSVQTTFLLVPQRGRVLATKAAALTVLGLGLAAVAAAAASGTLWLVPDTVDWTGAARALVVSVLSGAAFAVTGAGIGAAVGNSAAALTGTYLTVLGAFPVLQQVEPEWVEKLDPTTAVVVLAHGGAATTPVLVIAGWVVVSTLLGATITRRRAVQ